MLPLRRESNLIEAIIKEAKYEWFYDMPNQQQKQYLKEHPDSGISKKIRDEQKGGISNLKQKLKDALPSGKKYKQDEKEGLEWNKNQESLQKKKDELQKKDEFKKNDELQRTEQTKKFVKKNPDLTKLPSNDVVGIARGWGDLEGNGDEFKLTDKKIIQKAKEEVKRRDDSDEKLFIDMLHDSQNMGKEEYNKKYKLEDGKQTEDTPKFYNTKPGERYDGVPNYDEAKELFDSEVKKRTRKED